ncbi:DUF998 domain-containing protein [Microbacterium gorillae]|uniref:DUF998 domain-containing protein n=1 Tax=Microbacterium gorillae TaxID=1231063 RepID=UPI003D9622B2
MRTRIRAGWRWLRTAIAEPSLQRIEAIALLAAASGGVIAGLLALVTFAFRTVPIAGADSIGQFAAVTAAVVAVLAFALASWLDYLRTRERPRFLDIVDGIALALAYGVIAALSWSLVADILARGFVDADVYTVPSALIAASVAAITGYVVFISASQLDLTQFALILAVFLVQGVLAATLSADDPHWWEDNLSALGMVGETSSSLFNLTVIVAGVLVTALARYATRGLWARDPRGTRNVRIGLIVIGCCLMVVGLIPVNVSFLVHTGFASGMLVVFAGMIVMIARWIPGIARSFVVLGWTFLGISAGLVLFFVVGYYTLTAVEIVAGGLVFTWILLLIRAIDALVRDTTPDAAAVEQVV